MHLTILVTCFFDTTRYRSNKQRGTREEYWDSKLMEVNSPLVIYGDIEYIEYVKKLRGDKPTEYIPMTLEELPLWSYYDQVEDNRKKCWPSADDRAPTSVHIITCSKIYLVADAIRRNTFQTEQFAFIDCNVLKKANVNIEQLNVVCNTRVHKFHIMAIGVVNDKLSYEQLYESYRYVVSGGFFITDIEHGLQVKDLFHDEFIRTTNAGYGHGEEMIYTKLINPYWHLFHLGYGDYSEYITNIFHVIKNHRYVLERCIIGYCNERYYPQLEHCCKIMLDSHLESSLRFEVLYYLYIAYYWQHNQEGVVKTIQDMSKLTYSDEYAKKEYLRRKKFYDDNLIYAKRYFDNEGLVFPRMVSLTLCIAISCYKPHVHFLPLLLDNVRKQTRKPDQVIIMSSETQALDVKDIILDEGWMLCIRPESANAANNRNYMAKICECDIISFVDADNLIHPERSKFIMEMFERDADLAMVLHSFNFVDEPTEDYKICPQSVNLTYVNGYLLPVDNQRIHNGHASIRRKYLLDLPYNQHLKIGEDVDLNVRFYNTGNKIAYIPAKLTTYNKERSNTIYGDLTYNADIST